MYSYSKPVALKELRGDALNRKRNVRMTGSFETVPHNGNHDFSNFSHSYDSDLTKAPLTSLGGVHKLTAGIVKGGFIQKAMICRLMTWILLRVPHTKSHCMHGVSHTNDLDFAKGASYKQPRFAWGCPY